MKRYMERNGVKASDTDILGVMKRYDRNGDGKVSLGEVELDAIN